MSVPADTVLYLTAKMLNERYGDEAALRAVEQADQLFESGNLDGSVMWTRIMEAVVKIERL